MSTHRSKLQALVGVDVAFEHFAKVSGVQAVAEARQRLDARLAARGAHLSCRDCQLHTDRCMHALHCLRTHLQMYAKGDVTRQQRGLCSSGFDVPAFGAIASTMSNSLERL